MIIFDEKYKLGDILFSDQGDTVFTNKLPYNVYIENYYSQEEHSRLLAQAHQTFDDIQSLEDKTFDACCYKGDVYYFPEKQSPIYAYEIAGRDEDKDYFIFQETELETKFDCSPILRFQDILSNEAILEGVDKSTLKDIRNGKINLKGIISIIDKARIKGILRELCDQTKSDSKVSK